MAMLDPLYHVSLTKRARRETRKLDRQILARIAAAIDGLAADPRPPGSLKVKLRKGSGGFALVIGGSVTRSMTRIGRLPS